MIMKVANTWLILNVGGGPRDDKPTVTLTTPPDPNRTSAFLNVRVADIDKVYRNGRPRRRVPHGTEGPRMRDPRVHPRPRRSLDRGRPNDRPSQLISGGGLPPLARSARQPLSAGGGRPAVKRRRPAFQQQPGGQQSGGHSGGQFASCRMGSPPSYRR